MAQKKFLTFSRTFTFGDRVKNNNIAYSFEDELQLQNISPKFK